MKLTLAVIVMAAAIPAYADFCGSIVGNLVTPNCGFETGNFTGWTLSGNPGFISITTDAHSGNSAAEFGAVGSPTTLTLSTTLATSPGTATLDFWLKNLGGPVNLFDVVWDGNVVFNITNANAFAYTEETLTLSALGNDTLAFNFQQNPSFWHFDDVSVVQTAGSVPEPSSVVLLLTVLGCFCATLRRKVQN